MISQENNFQVIVATDGDQTYAVFTYQCGELNWIQGDSASIGFSAGPNLFANHPLSRQPNVNDIACVNQTCSPWTNVVYRISSDPSCELNYNYFVSLYQSYAYSYTRNLRFLWIQRLCSTGILAPSVVFPVRSRLAFKANDSSCYICIYNTSSS